MTTTCDDHPRRPPVTTTRDDQARTLCGGHIAAGAKLPTVRGLADSLGIAPNTVARSYRELERDAVIETRGRAGTFVASSGDATHRQAQDAAAAFAARIRQLRLDPGTALELVRAALR